MQFQKRFKQAIAAGDVTLTFRTWKKPQARRGGRYNIPPYGAIEVTEVDQIGVERLTAKQARQSGFSDKAELVRFLDVEPGDLVWRVALRYLGQQPVNQPERARLSDEELHRTVERLARWDTRVPWTHTALGLIKAHPGRRAGDLAPQLELPLPEFKRKVRQLKGLGLTESLEVGYRLSARGQQVLATLDKETD